MLCLQPKCPVAGAHCATARSKTLATVLPAKPKALPLPFAAAAALVVLGTPLDVQAADMALGGQVFNGNCAACHQGGRNVVAAEKTLDKAALEKYLDGGFNVDAIIYQAGSARAFDTIEVENGKGAMPAWADRLSEEEIRAVAEYVYATAAADAWS